MSVAKPGMKVLIVDETEKVVEDIYEKTPLTNQKVFPETQNSGHKSC